MVDHRHFGMLKGLELGLGLERASAMSELGVADGHFAQEAKQTQETRTAFVRTSLVDTY